MRVGADGCTGITVWFIMCKVWENYWNWNLLARLIFIHVDTSMSPGIQ